MKKKSSDDLNKYTSGVSLLKETAKARYENLDNEKKKESVQPFENVLETKIKMAMAAGDFDNLPGKGKKLDLDGYRALPEHLRVGYQMLKNSGYLPEEVRLKKEMETIKEKIGTCTSAKKKEKLMKKLTDISQQYHFHMEYNKKYKKTLF